LCYFYGNIPFKSICLKRITIKDIARELNLHHSTVSRALHNDAAVNPETARKVMELAHEMGYQVNMSALQLRGSIRNSIAVLFPTSTTASFQIL
jgi:LacI family transcriptional regulator